MTTTTLRTIAQRGSGAKARSAMRRAAALLALPAILVALWWFGSAGSTNYLNPPLSTTIAEFWPTWFGGEDFMATRFMRDVVPSVLRILAGYTLALVAGIVLGITVGTSRRIRATVEPVLEFFRAIPPPVLVPIFMLFMGIGDGMKIAVIAIGCLWPILLNTVEGVRAIDPVLRDTARSYRFSRWGTLRRVTLPGASPQIVTGARQALSIGIILMVISEMFAAKDGLGFTIVQFQRSFAIPQMWGGVILLGVLGALLSLVFRVISGSVLTWYHGYLQTQREGA
ncbi:ABC transporter permease [Leucobacter luti]|uniref:ABC-type nitrate/sulfonate/bicarbonate transport system permease component n=1 Tax=Leucobacter luti TaxID=340320 RepID=A0A4Q7U2N2_9MICO|nr:ABC transporter permease [Leucobacter luti]MBL3699190.1 ABC transporter permease [Leucobacter luti]RZT66688.1 ABC-type nitrate/sulfonate/bicarbonate transport system permease component [Leucobacter luti]